MTTTANNALAAVPEPPVDKESLAKEHAAPTLAGVRSVLFNAEFGALDPMRLKHILNAAAQGQADDYLSLAEEMEEKYLHYAGQLQTRKLAVCGLDITVEAASDDAVHQKHADLIREYLNRDTVDDETFDIQDALGKGYSVTELIWDPTQRPWLPKLKTRDPRFFEFAPADLDTLLLRGGPDNDDYVPVPLEPMKFIVHRRSHKTGLAVRGGLARACAWVYLFQSMSVKDWVIMAEVYGMPIRVGKYGAGATDDDRRKLLNAVVNIATDAGAIIPDSMVIEFIAAGAGIGPDIYRELCTYLDQQVSKVIVGQTGTADATTGGFGSSGEAHSEVREDIRDADAKALAATLNRDLVRPTIDVNFGPPIDGKYPRIRIGRAEQFTTEQATMIYDFVDRGGKVGMSYLRDKLGLEDPADDEELVQPKTAAQIAPTDADDPTGAPTDAKKPGPAQKRALEGLKRALKSETTLQGASEPEPEPDAIDRLVEGGASEWVEIIAPLIDGIEGMAAQATSLEEVRDRLTSLIAQDPDGLTDLLARSMFNARLAGEAGIEP